MKKETENKQVFSFKKGHTLPMSDEYFDFLENCQKALLIGNLRGMIFENNGNGKPSFLATSGIGNEKAKMAFTFYKRFSDINKFTHFLVHEDDLQYYKDFIENFALETGQVFTHRLRGKSTEYKIAFIPPIVDQNTKSSINIGDEYRKDLETLSSFEVGSDEQDKQIKYMLQKYVAICLNYTDGKLNEVYTDHGNITVIVYKDNKMFTNVYSKVNKITGEKIEFRDFDNVQKMFNDRINGFKGKKTMTYDFIIMNPPYGSIGGPVATEAKKWADKTVCLMPLSCYKTEKNELYRYVDKIELADPDMFEDATITNNLCICTLRKSVVDKFKTYEELSMESYDPRFKVFYEVNKYSVGDFSCTGIDSIKINRLSEYNQDTAFYVYSRTAGHGVHKSGYDVEYNVNKFIGIDGLPLNTSKGHNNLIGGFIVFTKKIGKDNFTLWWYKGEGELADKVIHSMNKNIGSIEPVIPRINWGVISDTQLWKEGKYDEAVLDVMELKWNDDKSGVVRK